MDFDNHVKSLQREAELAVQNITLMKQIRDLRNELNELKNLKREGPIQRSTVPFKKPKTESNASTEQYLDEFSSNSSDFDDFKIKHEPKREIKRAPRRENRREKIKRPIKSEPEMVKVETEHVKMEEDMGDLISLADEPMAANASGQQSLLDLPIPDHEKPASNVESAKPASDAEDEDEGDLVLPEDDVTTSFQLTKRSPPETPSASGLTSNFPTPASSLNPNMPAFYPGGSPRHFPGPMGSAFYGGSPRGGGRFPSGGGGGYGGYRGDRDGGGRAAAGDDWYGNRGVPLDVIYGVQYRPSEAYFVAANNSASETAGGDVQATAAATLLFGRTVIVSNLPEDIGLDEALAAVRGGAIVRAVLADVVTVGENSDRGEAVAVNNGPNLDGIEESPVEASTSGNCTTVPTSSGSKALVPVKKRIKTLRLTFAQAPNAARYASYASQHANKLFNKDRLHDPCNAPLKVTVQLTTSPTYPLRLDQARRLGVGNAGAGAFNPANGGGGGPAVETGGKLLSRVVVVEGVECSAAGVSILLRDMGLLVGAAELDDPPPTGGDAGVAGVPVWYKLAAVEGIWYGSDEINEVLTAERRHLRARLNLTPRDTPEVRDDESRPTTGAEEEAKGDGQLKTEQKQRRAPFGTLTVAFADVRAAEYALEAAERRARFSNMFMANGGFYGGSHGGTHGNNNDNDMATNTGGQRPIMKAYCAADPCAGPVSELDSAVNRDGVDSEAAFHSNGYSGINLLDAIHTLGLELVIDALRQIVLTHGEMSTRATAENLKRKVRIVELMRRFREKKAVQDNHHFENLEDKARVHEQEAVKEPVLIKLEE